MLQKPISAATVAKLALGLLALLAAFGLRLWRFGGAPPLPTLLQGLTDAHDAASQQAFIRRLREKFPLGAPETGLIQELRSEGFQLRTDARAGQRIASYDRVAGLEDVCRRGGAIRWSLDEAGKLSDISGGFYVYCP